jgi:drug/metabolite transporter (DMT)-like permease
MKDQPPLNSNDASLLRGFFYAGGVVLFFSSFTLFSRAGLSSVLGIADLAALRFGISGILLSPIILAYGLCGLRLAQAATLALLGGLGFALCAYAGFSMAPAAHAAVLLHGTLPLTTALILTVMGAGATSRSQALGFALIVIGVAAILADTVLESYRPAQLIGDGLLLLASFSWSGYGVLAKRYGVPALRAAAIVAAFSMAAYLPAYLATSASSLLNIDWKILVAQGIFQGIAIGVLSLLLYTRTVAILGAARTALTTAAVPATTLAGGMLFLAETPAPTAVAGITAVTVGMLVALSSRRLGGAR